MMRRAASTCAAAALCCAAAFAQPAMTLEQARQTALRNHPRIASAQFEAQASGFAIQEVRSAFLPTVYANVTGAGSEHGAVLSAGAVTTSSLYSRGSSGFVANQLLTDFGRTSNLERSARLRSASRESAVSNTRAQVLVEVQQAYYQALADESVLQVAQATLDLRRLTLRQVTALARSSLRSTVDVSFAQVNVSQAELDLYRAEDSAKASHARLSAAIGYPNDQPYSLTDEPLPPALNPDVDQLIAQAMHERPDLASLQYSHEALATYAEAEKDLRNPSINAIAVAGAAPVRDDRLPKTYSAAAINVTIPVLNGGLFKARREEAESHAAAADKNAQDMAVQIARDVRVAWLEANDAFRRLDVTARLVAEANEALRLAQARYDNALGSIVELNQAQLNQTSAEITAATAKYEYLARRAVLDYETGVLR
ncbi:MAG TPA: TolC family protein [Verrucomicrobiae bacterium]|nr:TolC family protein [Verrucomicrobiae bacterium]